MTKRKRRRFTGEEKVAILRRHFLDKVPVSDLCEEYGLHPTVFYRWQQALFENGAAAFRVDSKRDENAQEKKIEALEAKIRRKDEVVAELLADHVALKKSLGEI
jgi:transposase